MLCSFYVVCGGVEKVYRSANKLKISGVKIVKRDRYKSKEKHCANKHPATKT